MVADVSHFVVVSAAQQACVATTVSMTAQLLTRVLVGSRLEYYSAPLPPIPEEVLQVDIAPGTYAAVSGLHVLVVC
jgi:hypothetical protein